MIRAGLGRLERSNLIVSAFRGKKQLFFGQAGGSGLITISGLSLEGKVAISKFSYLKGEIASTTNENLRSSDIGTKARNSIGGRENSAFSIFGYAFIPLTQTVVEGS